MRERGQKKTLRAALCLAAEDFLLPVPRMPSRIGRGRTRPKKTSLLRTKWGTFCRPRCRMKRYLLCFSFLTGVRPSEQLALLWEDVDLQPRRIRIRRTQEPSGSVVELTKTAASTREIPISALLRPMLEKWRAVCPVGEDNQHRVFPWGAGHKNTEREDVLSRIPTSFTPTGDRPFPRWNSLLLRRIAHVTPSSAHCKPTAWRSDWWPSSPVMPMRLLRLAITPKPFAVGDARFRRWKQPTVRITHLSALVPSAER